MPREVPKTQNLKDLAEWLQEIIDEEGFDTFVRDGLYGVIERLHELSETHKPDILRDIRDLGWAVLSHTDLVDATNYCPGESAPVKWMFHKLGDTFKKIDGIVVEGRSRTDEEALWIAAGRIARHELPSEKAVKYADKLLTKGTPFKKAIEAAKEKFKED